MLKLLAMACVTHMLSKTYNSFPAENSFPKESLMN